MKGNSVPCKKTANAPGMPTTGGHTGGFKGGHGKHQPARKG